MPELHPAFVAPDARGDILGAALEVFARYGFDGTTMRRIADAAGVSAGLIHHHFKDKETLWNTVGAHITEDFRAWMEKELPAQTEDVDAQTIPRMLHAYMDYWQQHPAALRFQLWRVLGAPDTERKARSRQLNQAYVPMFAQAQKIGLIRDDIPAGQAMITTGALIQFWLHSRLEVADAIAAGGGELPDDEAFLQYIIGLVLPRGRRRR